MVTPTPPAKGTAKDTPPPIPAAKAPTVPQPVQGKASGSPSTLPVTQTPIIPEPLEGEVRDDGSHITNPAVGAEPNSNLPRGESMRKNFQPSQPLIVPKAKEPVATPFNDRNLVSRKHWNNK